MAVKAGFGVALGLAWFLVLAVCQTAADTALGQVHAPWPPLLVGAAASGLVIYGLRRAGGSEVAAGVAAGIAIGLLVGLLEGPTAPVVGADLVEFPRVLGVGLSSPAVWTALGVAVALSGGAHRRTRSVVEDRTDSTSAH